METISRSRLAAATAGCRWQSLSSSAGQFGSETESPLSLPEARLAVRPTALWAGRTVAGRRLRRIRLASIMSRFEGGPQRVAAELRLNYGRLSSPLLTDSAFVQVKEMGGDAASFWRAEGIVAPPAGYLDLTSVRIGARTERVRWQGRLRKRGVLIEIDSWSRWAVLTTARALRPIPR